MVVVSPTMKKNFDSFGQVVCYDLTYNLIQEIGPSNRQYAVGVFSGVNCFNKIIPFGITITCVETADSFYSIFKTFIEICGTPKTFITNEQSSMLSAFDTLRAR